MNIKIILYIVVVPLVIWVLESINTNNLFKKNKFNQARILYILVSLSLSYLVVNFIYDYYISLSLYLDGRKSNNNEIKKDIKEIEDKLLNAEDGSIFCDTMINELHGRYYKIMYNKEYSDNFNKS